MESRSLKVYSRRKIQGDEDVKQTVLWKAMHLQDGPQYEKLGGMSQLLGSIESFAWVRPNKLQ